MVQHDRGLNLRISKELRDKLNEEAKKRGITAAELIREYIRSL